MLPFAIGWSLIFVFYILLSSFIQRSYFWKRSSQSEIISWKIQPKSCSNVGNKARVPWLPFFHAFHRSRRDGGKELCYAEYATCNLFVACCFAGTVSQLAMSGRTLLVFDLSAAGGWLGAAVTTVLAILWQSIVEYYWHRLMHVPFMYKRFHKIHHSNTSPEPFDDMVIHPLEAFGMLSRQMCHMCHTK